MDENENPGGGHGGGGQRQSGVPLRDPNAPPEEFMPEDWEPGCRCADLIEEEAAKRGYRVVEPGGLTRAKALCYFVERYYPNDERIWNKIDQAISLMHEYPQTSECLRGLAEYPDGAYPAKEASRLLKAMRILESFGLIE